MWIVGLLVVLLIQVHPSFASETTLTISTGWGSITDQFAGALTRYTEKTGVQFQSVTPPGGVDPHHESLLVQFAAGTAPDLLFVEGKWIEQFVAANLLLPLDDFYERDVDFSEFLEIFDSSRVEGRLYGFPAVGGGYRVNAHYINQDHFQSAGLAIPGPDNSDAVDYPTLLDVARRMTIDRDNDGMPEQWGITFGLGWGVWTGWLPSNGARVFNAEKTEVLLDRPEAVEVFQLLRDLNVTYGARGGNFPQGTAAIAFGIRANQVAWTPAIGESFTWSVAPVAKGRAGSVGVLNMNSIAINRDTNHAEEAWRYILHLMSEEEQNLRAAEGLAVARKSSAFAYQMLDVPPYDLAPFLHGPTVNRQTMTMPKGAAWPAEADDYIMQVLTGELDPGIGVKQAADVLRREIAAMR